jgi:hypothetical protein
MTVGANNAQTFRSVFGSVIPAKATVDVASLVDGAGATQTVAVAGAALGDFVIVACTLDNQDITVTAYVDSADSVQIRFQNESTATVDLASQTVHIAVLKPGHVFEGL